MSNGVRGPSDAVTDDPARWAAVDRPAVRAHFDATAGAHSVGREVFEQAEAILGSADVPPAEFASWLHFAATVLGHDAYAARIAAAEPDMTEVFVAEMDALAPGLLDPDTPRGVLWSHFTWALTEWDGDLFWLR
ncbi:hypothetical protein YWIDRAFT_06447 [Streptomyces sp. SceaMP-e96]|uniref:hypothetical protein n=1 Tax=unclassified Streptomyces TaxID=2593676 RepID=UPI0008239094|nr:MULTISPECIES: hypothetical protein [unclassified Streptomyces]MYT16871.1 hypothetical protein [Streptomyces sp. SID4951]SCK35735.1 hypothetical protein YWIDRAFT_06447 [Streptomyces sp. SceaMP-e96]